MFRQCQNIDKIGKSYYFIYCHIFTPQTFASVFAATESIPSRIKQLIFSGLYFQAASVQIREI
jgi:hypothetical protein